MPAHSGESTRRLASRLNEALARNFVVTAETEPNLRAVVTETLANPGHLFRAQLVWRTVTALGGNAAVADSLACGVEYFHIASFLLDDLPCMDDAKMRRGRPCPHLERGDATVILAALGFINRAYGLIWRDLAPLSLERRGAANLCLDEQLGLSGILNGQAHDLRFGQRAHSARKTSQIALGKTVALFRLALEFPAAVSGASMEEEKLLRRLSVAWGLFYQACDDLGDFSHGTNLRETPGRDALLVRPNLLLALGPEVFMRRLDRLARQAKASVAELIRLRPSWLFLEDAHRCLEDTLEVPDRLRLLARTG
jgi:geranylgeranyl diphosphate synthase type II